MIKKIKCPHCKFIFVAHEKLAGKVTNCPECHKEVQIPATPQRSRESERAEQVESIVDSWSNLPTECPFCAETILSQAIKCKHCGEFLDGTPSTSVWSPGLAALLSFVLPGLGQLYKGQFLIGFLLFLLTAAEITVTFVLLAVTENIWPFAIPVAWHFFVAYDAFHTEPKL